MATEEQAISSIAATVHVMVATLEGIVSWQNAHLKRHLEEQEAAARETPANSLATELARNAILDSIAGPPADGVPPTTDTVTPASPSDAVSVFMTRTIQPLLQQHGLLAEDDHSHVEQCFACLGLAVAFRSWFETHVPAVPGPNSTSLKPGSSLSAAERYRADLKDSQSSESSEAYSESLGHALSRPTVRDEG